MHVNSCTVWVYLNSVQAVVPLGPRDVNVLFVTSYGSFLSLSAMVASGLIRVNCLFVYVSISVSYKSVKYKTTVNDTTSIHKVQNYPSLIGLG